MWYPTFCMRRIKWAIWLVAIGSCRWLWSDDSRGEVGTRKHLWLTQIILRLWGNLIKNIQVNILNTLCHVWSVTRSMLLLWLIWIMIHVSLGCPQSSVPQHRLVSLIIDVPKTDWLTFLHGLHKSLFICGKDFLPRTDWVKKYWPFYLIH